MLKQMLGAKKDPKDDRDYKIKGYLKVGVESLPVKMDLSNVMTPVRNQGGEGSCVSFAAAAFKEFQESAVNGYLAPRFLTDIIQESYDSGAYPRDALIALQKMGIPPESCQPYKERTPTPACPHSLLLAAPNKIKAYARLYTVDEMKRYLCEHGAFLASFTVTDTWFKPVGGLVIPEGPIVGGHAVCVVGYDDERGVIKFKNSWGTEWGQGGYGYLPYISVVQHLMDAWAVVDVPEVEEEKAPEPTPAPRKNWLVMLIEMIMRMLRR